jgi:hypothetical protein
VNLESDDKGAGGADRTAVKEKADEASQEPDLGTAKTIATAVPIRRARSPFFIPRCRLTIWM